MKNLLLLVLCIGLLQADPQDKNDYLARIDRAIEKGVNYLVKKQLRDGSWSRFRQPLAHPLAITSLCTLALIKTADKGKQKVKEAIEKGIRFVLRTVKRKAKRIYRKKRPTGQDKGSYRTFGYGYALKLLLKIRNTSNNREQIDKLIKMLITIIQKIQYKGGWIYQWQCAGPKPYLSAVMLRGLLDAREQGFQVNQKRLKRAVKTLRRSRSKDGGYPYMDIGQKTRFTSSLERVANCDLALYKAGAITRDTLKKTIKKFFRHYKSYRKVVGYHYLFGLYYTSECLKLLKQEIKNRYPQTLARTILKKQSKKGFWFDHRLCGREYGTALGLLILANIKECLGK
jgi:hypothetical protein